MRIIGLTGGIASGKSTASRYFKERGMPVIDADSVTHQLMAPGNENYAKIVQEYGTEILTEDGSIDRKRLGALAFSSPKALLRLEKLTHPAIKCRLEELVKEYRQMPSKGCVLLDHPLLLEMGMAGLADEIWLVACTRENQISRLKTRDRLTPQAIEDRLAAQMPTEEKIRKAHRVIVNDGTREEFITQLDEVWKERCLCSPESL